MSSDLGPSRHRSHLHRIFGHSLDYSDTYSHAANASNPVIYVTDYGADPTGQSDSTAAIQSAISVALSRGSANAILSNNIHDCGGATVHLGGGDYLISAPLIIPQYFGNLRLVFGTVRAAKNFSPSTSYLLIVGDDSKGACSNSQGSCNENVAIENMMFDSSLVVHGCVRVIATMGFVVGTQMFFLGFTGAGFTISGGHETMMSDSWFGEYLYSSADYKNAKATGVEIFGNDHYLTNVIVFSSKIGVHITNPANILSGVHTWNMNTGDGGIGILVESTQTRLIGCYLDGNDLILTAPIETVSQEDGFFLYDGRIILRANGANSVINGLSVVDNQFMAGGSAPIISLDESNGQFTSVSNMVVRDNLLQSGHVYHQPRLSATLTHKAATSFTFDFTSDLLFDCSRIPIAWVSYTVQFDQQNTFAAHALQQPDGGKVTVAFNQAVDATVYMTVDQSSNACY